MSTQPQPRVLGTSHGKREDTLGRSTATARRWADTIERTGSPATCNGAESNVVRRDAGRQKSAAVLVQLQIGIFYKRWFWRPSDVLWVFMVFKHV